MTSLDGFVVELAQALEDVSDPSTKEWWERYLRRDAQFRGVKMADTRRIVNALVKRHDLGESEASGYLQLAHECFAQPFSEDKLAGVLLLAEHGLATLRIEHADALAQPWRTASVHTGTCVIGTASRHSVLSSQWGLTLNPGLAQLHHG